MDTRRLRRWLGSRDPVDVVLLVGQASESAAPGPGPGPGAGRTERFGLRRAKTREACAVTIADSEALEAADILELLTCTNRVDVVLPGEVPGESVDAEPEGAPSGVTVAGSCVDGSEVRDRVSAVVARAAELAAMCGRGGDVGVAEPEAASGMPRIDPDHVPMGRRALIGAPDRPLPEPAATPQRRLVDAVSALLAVGERTASEIEHAEPAAPTTGSAKLTAKGCCGDGLCVRVCPNDALRLEVVELDRSDRPGPPGVGAPPKAQSQFRLVQVAADCDGCEACVEMCPNGALHRLGDHSWSDLLKDAEPVLRTGWVRACTRCGAAHRRMGDLCAVCKAQQENPFAVRLPPGATGRW